MAKQSDHIDKKFREAAENISVPPNPMAWEKMEQLLDGEDRRRPVVFWWYLLFFSVLGIIGFFGYRSLKEPSGNTTTVKTNPMRSPDLSAGNTTIPSSSGLVENDVSRNDKSDHSLPVPVTSSPSQKGKEKQIHGDLTVPQATSKDGTGEAVDIDRVAGKDNNYNPAPKTPIKPRRLQNSSAGYNSGIVGLKEKRIATKDSRRSEKQSSPTTENPSGINSRSVREASKPDLPATDLSSEKNAADSGRMKTDLEKTNLPDSNAVSKSPQAIKPALKKDSALRSQIKITPPKAIWKLERGFNISAIGKLDVTALHGISLQQFKTIFAVGVGYRITNRLSVQSGASIQRAIYFAGPGDYTVKPGTYLSYYRISKIDANCLFYEIPLLLRYDFLIGKGVRFYSAAGFNSYIMKNESYRYHASGPSGYRMFDSTYTSNRNIFASVFLSAGVEKKLTPSFSLQLEPYVTLPNSGIGAGKVKLYSAGTQLSIKFQPVKKKSIRK